MFSENPPFQRGQTYYNGRTIDSNDLEGTNLEGTKWFFPDVLQSDTGGIKSLRTNQIVECTVVRNVAAAAILGKRLVTYQATAGNYGKRVDGYARTTAVAVAGATDEYLPSAGCPVNDLCYIVTRGPAVILTDLAGADNNVLNINDVVVALTAASSGATTSGRVRPQDLTGATALLADQVQNSVGRAMSAKTTAQTNSEVLINLFIKF